MVGGAYNLAQKSYDVQKTSNNGKGPTVENK